MFSLLHPLVAYMLTEKRHHDLLYMYCIVNAAIVYMQMVCQFGAWHFQPLHNKLENVSALLIRHVIHIIFYYQTTALTLNDASAIANYKHLLRVATPSGVNILRP